MEGAFQWLSQIADWLGRWIPRWQIIDTTYGGVKFVGYLLPQTLRVKCGGFPGDMKVLKLGPGIHWFWPATSTLNVYPIARQADDLRSQTFVTTDGRTVTVGGMLVYEVEDIEKLLAHTYQASQTVKDIALTAIHDVCCQMAWEELLLAQRKGTLDTKLKAEAKKALEPYGVKVLKTMLTDLAPCRVLRLVQSTATDN